MSDATLDVEKGVEEKPREVVPLGQPVFPPFDMDFFRVLYTVQKMVGLKLSSGTLPRDVSSRQGQP